MNTDSSTDLHFESRSSLRICGRQASQFSRLRVSGLVKGEKSRFLATVAIATRIQFSQHVCFVEKPTKKSRFSEIQRQERKDEGHGISDFFFYKRSETVEVKMPKSTMTNVMSIGMQTEVTKVPLGQRRATELATELPKTKGTRGKTLKSLYVPVVAN